MTRFAIPAAVFILALAGCSSGGGWVKEGVSEKQVEADQQACREQAEQSFGGSLDTTRDIRTGDVGGREDLRDLVTSTRDYKDARRYDRLYDRCMDAKGYVRRK